MNESTQQTLRQLKEIIEQGIQALHLKDQNNRLFVPADYALSHGGKRFRPVLCLLSAKMLGAPTNASLPAALALELFHNFTLMHDDIMDEAPMRRGQDTVFKRFGINNTILSGDALLVKSYELFEGYEPSIFSKIMRAFNAMAITVCEGQHLDMLFEACESVSLAEYELMIEKKTAALLGASMELGALASDQTQAADQCKEFGIACGMSFQLQDDYLDTFGDPNDTGKQLGGDIKQCKKNYLFTAYLHTLDKSAQSSFIARYNASEKSDQEVANIIEAYKAAKLDAQLEQLRNQYFKRAMDLLRDIQGDEEIKAILSDLCQHSLFRNN